MSAGQTYVRKVLATVGGMRTRTVLVPFTHSHKQQSSITDTARVVLTPLLITTYCSRSLHTHLSSDKHRRPSGASHSSHQTLLDQSSLGEQPSWSTVPHRPSVNHRFSASCRLQVEKRHCLPSHRASLDTTRLDWIRTTVIRRQGSSIRKLISSLEYECECYWTKGYACADHWGGSGGEKKRFRRRIDRPPRGTVQISDVLPRPCGSGSGETWTRIVLADKLCA